EADAARRAIEQLAPQDAFRYIAADGPAAENAHAIFVQSVETAFQTYDKQKQEEEKQRKQREEEQKALEDQPPKVDVLPGDFALRMLPAGRQIFGDILPQPAPRAAWYARAIPRAEAAVALQLAAGGDPPALAFQAWGQGRVAFWAIGGDPESLGEVAAWADYPALFASSLRWLRPREEPDVRLVGDATPEGVRLLDPLPGAAYHLKTESAELPLELHDGLLKASEALPTGAAEIIESVDGLQRGIGDVYIATRPATSGVITGLDDNPQIATLSAKPPETRATRTPWWTAVLALSVLFLALMSFERLARRRA